MANPSIPSSSRSSEPRSGAPVSAPAHVSPRSGRTLAQLAGHRIDELRNVGARRAERFAMVGIETVLDLVTTYPNRYEDRSDLVAVAALCEGESASIDARVARVATRRARGRLLVEVLLADDTGEISCTLFNQPWIARQLHVGQRVVAYGKVARYRRTLQLQNPRIQRLADDVTVERAARVVPVYPESEKAGITSAFIEKCMHEALERAGELADPLPPALRQRHGLVGRTAAFHQIHRPAAKAETAPARRRLAFDELLRLQVALVMRKRAAAGAARGIAHEVAPPDADRHLVEAFLAGLPFAPTAAQRRVIAEIARDLASPLPMHRLLQGDVGAGKTVVALASLLYGVQGGHQGALMAPTEVLAEQHFLGARAMLAAMAVPGAGGGGAGRALALELLTSRTSAAERSRVVAGLRSGAVDLVVGTHALITDDVAFASLGVVVIDEQHRFGVDQRAALREKGAASPRARHDPDLLVMTATPIPRTAAMTVYGDLDYSVLDELPAGRTPVATQWVRDRDGEAAAFARVRAEVAAGRQAFVVCPLVRAGAPEQDPGFDPDVAPAAPSAAGRPARAAVEEAARLSAGELAGLRVGLLHGQLRASEKDEVMTRLRAGELDVLVATTVVEVGVDLPGATVMVVCDADRFGIAQLHQLRGRVGRGTHPSWCYLLADEEGVGDDARRRLEALEATSDGFLLADVDLELRGEGTVLGARQKGRNDLRVASLRRDRDLVLAARRAAEEIVASDPVLARHPLLAGELRLFIGEEEAEYLLRS